MNYILLTGPFGVKRSYIETLFTRVLGVCKVIQKATALHPAIIASLSRLQFCIYEAPSVPSCDVCVGPRDKMKVIMTPPLTDEEDMPAKRRKVHVNDAEVDDDEVSLSLLLDNYAPLSNLPTPPISKEVSPRETSSDEAGADPDMTYKEPANYLADVIRIREKCVPAMKVSRIEKMLRRACLDHQTIAFAACILNRLSWRFVRDWKNELLARQASGITESEVIVLAALYMASSWLNDRPRSVRYWLQDVGSCLTTRDAFLASQICILNDPSTNLMQIGCQEVEEMMEDLGLLGINVEGVA
ncbi:uncharacterized protein PV09_00844 [Verruconis gallopava]|uniref:Cyclin N-terminal domain-containing protein n=1 Tax=Verruconis gallopava TaxID=253628 RepID=A0A0D2AQJ0_9PEZI|nr:uncharacterized protein PV09_00844 [Verruconis gallopava]KIW08928.1 hypothetical protein PV09_00844 [Verruconis gallopava]